MKIIKNNFIVITGGPGGGKSTLLEALTEKGYMHVPETARQIIRERIQKGLPPRPGPEEFAHEMFQRDYQLFTRYLTEQKTIFFDRCFIDSAYLLSVSGSGYPSTVDEIVSRYRFCPRVFVLPPWKQIYKTDEERDQTFEESVTVFEKLCDWYRLNGYEPVTAPKLPVAGRVEFILHQTGTD